MGVHIVIVLYYTARPKVEVEIQQVMSSFCWFFCATCLIIEAVAEG